MLNDMKMELHASNEKTKLKRPYLFHKIIICIDAISYLFIQVNNCWSWSLVKISGRRYSLLKSASSSVTMDSFSWTSFSNSAGSLLPRVKFSPTLIEVHSLENHAHMCLFEQQGNPSRPSEDAKWARL